MLNPYTITMMQSNDPKDQVMYCIDEIQNEVEAAQDCFHRSNMGEVEFHHLRSMSVGDIVKVHDGEDTYWLMCLSVGWAQVEDEFVKPWLDLPYFTRVVHPLTRVDDPLEAMTLRVKMKRGIIPFVEGNTDDTAMQVP